MYVTNTERQHQSKETSSSQQIILTEIYNSESPNKNDL